MTATTIDLRPLTVGIGAQVAGLDLAAPLDAATTGALRDALARWGVLFFRDQELDHDAHVRLVESFGTPTVHPVSRLTGRNQAVTVIEDDADRPPAGFTWHTDLSWTPAPPEIGVLASLHVPDYGGDTLWASGALMWDRLPADLAERCLALEVEHQPDEKLLSSVLRYQGQEVVDQLVAAYPPRRHPLVRAHPHTGRPALYLSPLYVTGLVARDGTPVEPDLLDQLHRRIDDPEVQVRWRWRDGDVVLWDEVATTHRALTDHYPQHRRMRRGTVDGSVPVAWEPAA